MNNRHFMSWSGGKDSAFCLYKAQQQGLKTETLITNVNKTHNRVSMHGVRKELLERQASSIGLPLQVVELPEHPDMKVYEEMTGSLFQQLKHRGLTHGIFGDIFLEDLRLYREAQLKKEGMEGVFPLWEMNTHDLIREFIALGFKAIVVCVNSSLLDKSFCGRLIDETFINDLPASVDVCGEHGEYHSFVYDGPGFSWPVPFKKGELVYREYNAPSGKGQDDCFTNPAPPMGFYFCDLMIA